MFKENMSVPVETIAKHELGEPPDYVYRGFPTGTALNKSADYIKDNNIKVIVEVGDVFCFVADDSGYTNFGGIDVDYLIAQWRRIEQQYESVIGQLDGVGYKRYDDLLKAFMQKPNLKYAQKSLRHSQIIHVPWGINVEKYTQTKELERDIDVSLLGRWYSDRVLARQAILKMKGIKTVLASFPIPSEDTYGRRYIDILHRTKIFVATGIDKFLNAKFLEGPVCGTMLMGDIPFSATDIFQDGISIVEVKDFSKINEKITYYLKHDDERKQIAEEGRRRVLENFTFDKTAKEFETTLLKTR